MFKGFVRSIRVYRGFRSGEPGVRDFQGMSVASEIFVMLMQLW
ncbi:hypothetical protein [Allorhodopirellula heiligendammensis]|uniref:Uncharacterized protein n=1 Tax=Allorhodopirellula heiligendammensis TaxID=2714739 RepID=A0A5C6C260_9BACT|nr:hypothetical protein [Allorhodopirellula heiligendammensis]TWU18252.1 hypothetical protein Poly21_04070 [Allorhodopirellula heiligendammensis]